MTTAVSPRTDVIRALNDLLRQRFVGGRVVVTAGIRALGPTAIAQVVAAAAQFDDFTPGDDPYGEHDFGAFEVDGRQIFFKIDPYDCDYGYLSPDPSDPAVTRRVMTIMLADEY